MNNHIKQIKAHQETPSTGLLTLAKKPQEAGEVAHGKGEVPKLCLYGCEHVKAELNSCSLKNGASEHETQLFRLKVVIVQEILDLEACRSQGTKGSKDYRLLIGPCRVG